MSKRFWSHAECAPGEAGFRILLDGKPLRLPGGAVLALHHAPLAAAIAAEWQQAGSEKGGTFAPADVPLTGLAGSAQERIAPHRAGMIEVLARYAETDLLCYHVATPSDLARRQATQWHPWLDWAATRYAARLNVTTGIAHIPQPATSLAALHTTLAARSTEHLAALGIAIPALGSCILGLALADAALCPDDAVSLACLDELYQEQFWGLDPAHVARRAELRSDLALATRFMELSRD